MVPFLCFTEGIKMLMKKQKIEKKNHKRAQICTRARKLKEHRRKKMNIKALYLLKQCKLKQKWRTTLYL